MLFSLLFLCLLNLSAGQLAVTNPANPQVQLPTTPFPVSTPNSGLAVSPASVIMAGTTSFPVVATTNPQATAPASNGLGGVV
uniref:Uncharacterized protein n=1 Tax=Ditylenchus dipsaci TaxID=166011 RepID=A0A915DX84_9BILA